MTTGGAPVPIIYGGTGSTTASDARTALGLAIGTNVQAQDATLQSLSALGTAAAKLAITSGVDTWAEADFIQNTTWTPVIQGSTAAGAGTYSTQIGRYSKFGDIVFCTAYLVWSAHTGTGNMRLGGLPYTVRNTTNAFWSSGGNFFANITMVALSTYLCAYVQPNTTYLNFADMTPSAGSSSTAIDTAGTVIVTFMYSTAS